MGFNEYLIRMREHKMSLSFSAIQLVLDGMGMKLCMGMEVILVYGGSSGGQMI